MNAEQREQLRRLFRVKRIEGEMMLERGFLLNPVYLLEDPDTLSFLPHDLTFLQDTTLTLDQLLAERERRGILKGRQNFSSVYISADQTRMVVVFYLLNEKGREVKKSGFQIVDQYVSLQEEPGKAKPKHIILVTETGLRAENDKRVRERFPGYFIEVFLDSEFQRNILKDHLAPIKVKHIPGPQVARWGEEEQIQPEKLPMLLNTDPLAKRFGARPFDGFQEVVLGTTTDTAGFYRICRQSSVRQ